VTAASGYRLHAAKLNGVPNARGERGMGNLAELPTRQQFSPPRCPIDASTTTPQINHQLTMTAYLKPIELP
jgi:hypothetical protein